MVAVDFHGSPNAEKNLLKFLGRNYDCLLLLGDLTNFGPASLAESVLKRAKATSVPTLAVPGNCDPKQILQVLEKYGVNLYGRCKKLGGFTFVGLGGSNLSPFNTPFELTEAEIWEELTSSAPKIEGDWILATHAPPHDTQIDRIADGTHVGSKSIRRFIEQKQPLAALSGHVHEARDIDKLGRTVLVNPGPISKGYAAEISIVRSNEVHVELLEL